MKLIKINRWGTHAVIVAPWKYKQAIMHKFYQINVFHLHAVNHLYFVRFLKHTKENEI